MRGLSVRGFVLLIAGMLIFFNLVEPSLSEDQVNIDAPGLVFLGISAFLFLGGVIDILTPLVERVKRDRR